MKLHPEELQLARAYDRHRVFEPFTPEQVHLIMERGRALFRWSRAHPWLHNVVGVLVIASLLIADSWVLLALPRLLLAAADRVPSLGAELLSGVVIAFAHGWLLYSLVVYTLHEGAAHNAIFTGSGTSARLAQRVARNLGRIGQADPDYYADCHMGHHAKFGTEDDPEFLNFVLPQRLWASLIPFAVLTNVSDFIAHRSPTYTRSRILSGVVAVSYNGVYGWMMFRAFGAVVPLVVLALVLNVAFYFDRLRQFIEHNLMPLENRIGARNLGVGFWGLLIGGGPWGQPCHLAHHMVPSVPWYHQIVLHRYMKRLLTPQQRAQFLVTPVVGFPRLFWRVVRDAAGFARQQHVTLQG